MARNNNGDVSSTGRFRFVAATLLFIFCMLIFLFWRLDNVRVEAVRLVVIEKFVPNFNFLLTPFTMLQNIALDFRSYSNILELNRELNQEIQQLKYWKEQAIQWEAKYAKLLDLNNVKLDPKLQFISGVILADSGSGFRQNVLINIGSEDGVRVGWAATDGLGVVGRITGVGRSTALVMLLTDTASKVAIRVQPSGARAVIQGDNTKFPVLELLEKSKNVSAGDRVVTSGDGKVFPKGLLIGRVVEDSMGRKRVNLSANYSKLAFLRVMRMNEIEHVNESEALVGDEIVDTNVSSNQGIANE